MVIRIITLCLATAMICSAIRLQRPEMATVISLGAGLVVLALLWTEVQQSSDWIEAIRGLISSEGDIYGTVIKAAGIAVLAELGAQLCMDAGERALAGRISLAARVAMLGLCAPMLVEITTLLDGVLP